LVALGFAVVVSTGTVVAETVVAGTIFRIFGFTLAIADSVGVSPALRVPFEQTNCKTTKTDTTTSTTDKTLFIFLLKNFIVSPPFNTSKHK
jgi:hypothetical protein